MQNKKKPGRPCDTTPVGPESEVGIWVYSYSGRQLNTHYQKIMFSKNHSRNDAGTHRHPKKIPHHNDVGMVLGKGFVRVVVCSRIIAGTVFEEIF
jgi:hypothetical protein